MTAACMSRPRRARYGSPETVARERWRQTIHRSGISHGFATIVLDTDALYELDCIPFRPNNGNVHRAPIGAHCITARGRAEIEGWTKPKLTEWSVPWNWYRRRYMTRPETPK